MTHDEFNAFCGGLPMATHVVQWGGSDVWKVGEKVFAIAGGENDEPRVTFKVSELAFEMLRDQPGLRPAPYLASRGLKWIQHYDRPGLSDDELKAYLRASYEMVAGALPKKTRRQLGIAEFNTARGRPI